MRKRIHLVRHGETEWNLEKRIQGWGNSDLTAMGRKQAEILSAKLREVPFTDVFCSSSQRALDTARILIGGRKVPIVALDDLREIHFGEWERLKYEEIRESASGSAWDRFWNSPAEFSRNDHGEDFKQAGGRLNRCLDSMIDAATGDEILVVSHGVSIKLLMARFMNRPLDKLWEGPFIRETALSIAELVDGTWKVALEGDISHLEM